MKEFFENARRYQKAKAAKEKGFQPDLKYEAMLPVLEGKEPLIVMASRERAIRDAVQFADQQKVHVIIADPHELGKMGTELKSRNIPAILGPTLALPLHEDDPYDAAYTLPDQFYKAGVKFAFGTFDNEFSRNLPYQAATAVAFGLPYDEALKAVTLNAAQIWGVADRIGSIEEGKSADPESLTDGDPQFWGAVSDTGGASFGANFQISTGTSDDDTAGSGVDYGDYTWADSFGNTLHPVWSDNSNSTGDNPDGTNSRFDVYTAAVTIDNTPPVLTVPGPQSVDFNDPLTFGVSATDANAGDTLSFSASGLPAGLTLTDNGNRTATVSGTDTADPGVYTATITVNDHHNTPVSKTVQITVTKEETAILQTGTFTQDYHDPYLASATFTDPDGGAPIGNKLINIYARYRR